MGIVGLFESYEKIKKEYLEKNFIITLIIWFEKTEWAK